MVKTKDQNLLGSQPSCFSDGRHLRGVMLKRRRKKLQGYARRYFSLDYKYGTLNYFTSQNSSILRGSMPIKLCVVSARETSRDIYIDSGMEVWNVKPLNPMDFKTWVAALDVARLGASAIAQNSPQNYSDVLLSSMAPSAMANRLSYILTGTMGTNGVGSQNGVKRQTDERKQLSDRLENLVGRLESTALKANHGPERKGSPEIYGDTNVPRASGPQRRPSFWKRRSSRQSIAANTSPNEGNPSQEPCPHEIPPPIPASPLLPLTLAAASMDDLSKLNLRDSGSLKSNNAVLKQVATELLSLVDDFKLLVEDAKKRNRKSTTFTNRGQSGDAISVFSEEFFDAEEFDDPDPDGVVYLGKNNESSAEDEEDLAFGDDDAPSDEEDGNFTGDYARLPTPFRSRDEDTEELQDLYPLSEIQEEPKRRKTIPMAVSTPPNLLTIIRKNVGKDLSNVVMPVTANEPLTFLQRFNELFEHVDMISTGLTFPAKSAERIMYIATYAAVFNASAKAKERSTRKPFNPLLGETYELVRKGQGFRAITEKVSHRPLIVAMQAESADWTFQYAPSPHQQIWGKSVELNNKGTVRLTVTSSGEVYEWNAPTTFLRNVIAGEKYTEPVGSLTITCSNGWRCVCEYKAGGMFSGRSEDLGGRVFAPDGTEQVGYSLDGKWTTTVEMTTPGEPSKTIWTAGALVDGYTKRFGLTEYAASLNEITAVEKDQMAPTDSRLRPDLTMYENGDCDGAEESKELLELKQRKRRTEMENMGDVHKAMFFDQDPETHIWELKKGALNYWDRRKRQDWKGLLELY